MFSPENRIATQSKVKPLSKQPESPRGLRFDKLNGLLKRADKQYSHKLPEENTDLPSVAPSGRTRFPRR